MGTYYIPRNVKGEGRILYVFSTKALIYTCIGLGIGAIFYLLFKFLKLSLIGIVIMIFFGLLGFIIATFNVPETNAFKITKKIGGDKIDDVITRAIKFKMKKNKIYVYEREETNDNK